MNTLRAYISTLFHLLHVNCQLHALLLLLLQPPSSSCWLLQLEWEGAKQSPCPGRTPHAAVEWDGENSSVRPEMLWTMGCLPTKVNTQTTHSCPSLKHTHTHWLAHEHLTSIPVIPYLSSGFSFVKISDFWKKKIYPFCFGRSRSSCFWFSLLTFLRAYSAHTFLLQAWRVAYNPLRTSVPASV